MAKQSFEQKLRRLEEIVEILDRGDQTLDSMIKLYEEGMKLIAESRKTLGKAEQRITVIRAAQESAAADA